MKNLLHGLMIAALIAAPAALAAELGDPAAPLKISEWIKGKPVDLAAVKGKQIMVVEFWATWCAPCLTSIPHLTELQKKYKDVVFIGVTDEDAATVKKFVNKMGDQMNYTVAIDDNRQTANGYLGAFNLTGIPYSFIVDLEGRVVWYGHPLGGLAETLAEVVAGKFDIDKVKKRNAAEALMREFFDAAMEGTDEAKITRLGQQLEALDAEVGGLTVGRKFSAAEVRKSAKFRRLLNDYQLVVRSDKVGTNIARIEGLLREYAPPDFNLAEFIESVRLNQLFNQYCWAASGNGSPELLAVLGKQLGSMTTTNPTVLNDWARVLLTDPRIKTRDYALATKFARAGVDATGGKNLGLLETYARALFDSGKAAEAVEWQKKAIAAAENEDLKKQLEENLKQYQAKAASN